VAESKIPKTNKYVDRTIRVGSALYDDLYFADDDTYTSNSVLAVQVINVTDNHWATATLMGWATRIWTKIPNVDVTLRYLLK